MIEFLHANIVLLVALIAAGSAAGIAAGMFGVGGGVVIVPALFFALTSLGYEDTAMHIAVGTSLATIIATSVRSVLSHHKLGAVDWSVLKAWVPFIMLGALLGSFLASVMSGEWLTLFFGIVAFLLAAQLIWGRPTWRLREDVPKGPLGGAIGMVIGGCSSLMGIGGGVFGVSLLVLFGRPVHQAIGTSAGFGAAIGLPAAIGYMYNGWGNAGLPPLSIGYFSLPGFLIIAGLTTSLAPLGAKIAHGIDATKLKKIFGCLLIFTALNMLWKVLFG